MAEVSDSLLLEGRISYQEESRHKWYILKGLEKIKSQSQGIPPFHLGSSEHLWAVPASTGQHLRACHQLSQPVGIS